MSKTIVINSPSQLDELKKNNTIVVVDFHAVWCGPCKAVAPAYATLAERLTEPGKMVFAKVDVDQQKAIAQANNVTAMPTFIMFKSGTESTRIRGADLPALQSAVKELLAASGGAIGGSSGSGSAFWKGAEVPKPYDVINSEIEVKNLDAMNYNAELGSTVRTIFEGGEPSAKTSGGGGSAKGKGKGTGEGADWIESDTDEQLMLFIPFSSTVKIYQIQITSLPPPLTEDEEDDLELPRRPSKLKLFVNRPNIVGFDDAESMQATQEIEIKEEDWKDGTVAVNTRFVKFQSVFSLNLFVEDAEGDAEKVRIDRVRIVGEVGEKRDLGKLEKVSDE
ncbi:hypothetical protein TWF730_008673 [Orbilia blumenaviensis]|uniref:Thioredoxin n=1 Tax=Orbilia blumenaviensis TaxID=1796055 RepID=A0AAV9V620_9PEZI